MMITTKELFTRIANIMHLCSQLYPHYLVGSKWWGFTSLANKCTHHDPTSEGSELTISLHDMTVGVNSYAPLKLT